MPTITVNIVGVKFNNPDGSSRQKLLAELYDNWWTERKEARVKLRLRHEPENEHDPNAVSVWCVAPQAARGQLGYLPRGHAKVLSRRMSMIAGVKLVNMSPAISATIRIAVKRIVKDAEGREYELV